MEQEYILENCKSFEPEHIFECGQFLDGISKKIEAIQEYLNKML